MFSIVELLDRASGCILGAGVGDALGGVYEFDTQYLKNIKKDMQNGFLPMVGGGVYGLDPGQITDDTELAMKLAASIIQTNSIDPDKIARKYNEWYLSKPFDIGMSTQRSVVHDNASDMVNAARTMNTECLVKHGDVNLSNGMLMRISPLAVTIAGYVHRYQISKNGCDWSNDQALYQTIVGLVRDDTYLTHYSNEALSYSSAYVILIVSAILHKSFEPGIKMVRKYGNKHHGDWLQIFLKGIDADFTLAHSPRIMMGDVRIGFQLALCYGQQITGNEDEIQLRFHNALVDVLKLGGDTDTNACIVGSMMGSVVGTRGIPKEWKDTIRRSNPASGRYEDCTTNKLIRDTDTLSFKLFKIGYELFI